MNKNFKDKLGIFLFTMSIMVLGVLILTLIFKPFLGTDDWFTQGIIYYDWGKFIEIAISDVHPPLYYVMLKIFTMIFSGLNIDSINIMTFFSLIPAFIIVLISFTKIRNDYDWLTAGLFSFSALSMSLLFFDYLVCRMYSWGMLFTLLFFITIGNILNDEDDYKNWIYLTIFSILGCYTHYFAALIIILLYISIFVYFVFNNRLQLKKWFISVILNVIAYLPWLHILFSQAGKVGTSFWIKKQTAVQIINMFGVNFLGLKNMPFNFDIITLFTIITICIWIFSIKNYLNTKEKTDFYSCLGISTFILTIIFMEVISLTFKPLLISRYVIFSVILFWLGFSIFASKINNKKVITLLVCLLILAAMINITENENGISKLSTTTFDALDSLNEINNNNSIVLLQANYLNISFGKYLDKVTLYTLEYSKDFEEINVTDDRILNTDKDVFLIITKKDYEHINETFDPKIFDTSNHTKLKENLVLVKVTPITE